MEECQCILCGLAMYLTKWGVINGVYSWVEHKGRPKRRSYFHMACYKKITKGGRDASQKS